MRKHSLSPTISSAHRQNGNIVCFRVQAQNNAPANENEVKDIKSKQGPKYSEQVEKHVYYNPFNEGNEFFVKRKDIPELEPMWGDDKGEARDKVYSFLNSQNLRLVREIEPTAN